MHNRVRMVAASFLVKHLLIDWRIGEQWFWDTLCDADPANNPLNWQWVAGSGADAAPYFRVFNPVLQGEKFDADGDYVRRCPELVALPDKWIHKPWPAPENVLRRGPRIRHDLSETDRRPRRRSRAGACGFREDQGVEAHSSAGLAGFETHAPTLTKLGRPISYRATLGAK